MLLIRDSRLLLPLQCLTIVCSAYFPIRRPRILGYYTILDLELSVTEADIKLQLCKRLISNPATLGFEIDSILGQMQTTSSPSSRRVLGINKVRDDFTVQLDYISFSGLGNKDSIEWNYLDADKDTKINLF
jgi:hypothetical protein